MIGRSRARARRANPKPAGGGVVPATALLTETSSPLVTETGIIIVTE
jgi:hypothetical protein